MEKIERVEKVETYLATCELCDDELPFPCGALGCEAHCSSAVRPTARPAARATDVWLDFSTLSIGCYPATLCTLDAVST
jgi:hypothetical protein